jgi:ribosomal protein S18 acetylase RimI-like enzyme
VARARHPGPLMEIVRYEREHLAALLALAEDADLAASLVADPERANRALSAPGTVALVAVDDGQVLGFAYAITDGAFQAYLVLLIVAPAVRRRGVGRELVERSLAGSGAIRMDLLASEDAKPFYRALTDRGPWPGYRLHPPQ